MFDIGGLIDSENGSKSRRKNRLIKPLEYILLTRVFRVAVQQLESVRSEIMKALEPRVHCVAKDPFERPGLNIKQLTEPTAKLPLSSSLQGRYKP